MRNIKHQHGQDRTMAIVTTKRQLRLTIPPRLLLSLTLIILSSATRVSAATRPIILSSRPPPLRGGASTHSQSSAATSSSSTTTATKFPLPGILPDPFVAAAPLIVGVACSDGVLLLALHKGYHSNDGNHDDDDNDDDVETYLVMGDDGDDNDVNDGRYDIDLPRSYRGPFRIFPLQLEETGGGAVGGDGDGDDGARGCSVAMVSAGWRSDGQILARYGQSVAQREQSIFGTPSSSTTRGQNSQRNLQHALALGYYLASQMSLQMARRAIGGGQRGLSCVSLVASSSASSSSTPKKIDDGGKENNVLSASGGGGFLWLVDATGVYQVRAHAVGGGLVDSGGGGGGASKQDGNSMMIPLASPVNDHLARRDWTTMTCEEAATDLLELLFLVEDPQNKDPTSDDDDDDPGSSGFKKNSLVPRGTRVEMAIVGTKQKSSFPNRLKRLFGSNLLRNRKATTAAVDIRGGGGSNDSSSSSSVSLVVGILHASSHQQESNGGDGDEQMLAFTRHPSVLILDEGQSLNSSMDRISVSSLSTETEDWRDKIDMASLETLAESMALLCDVVALVLPHERGNNNDIGVSALSTAMNRGIQQRINAGLNKGRLLVVAGSRAKDPEWIRHIVRTDLVNIEPQQWAELEIVESMEQVNELLVDVSSSDNGVSEAATTLTSLLPTEQSNMRTGLLKSLLMQTYKAKQQVGAATERVAFALERTAAVPVSEGNKEIWNEPTFIDKSVSRLTAKKKQQQSTLPHSVDPIDVAESVLREAQNRLEELESRMQEVALQSSSSNSMPLLDFGKSSSDLLERTNARLEADEAKLPLALRRGILQGIVRQVHQLYLDQLQALRNYYGQRYEGMLAKTASLDPRKREQENAAAAQHMVQGFQAAAQNAVPQLIASDAPLLKMSNPGGSNSSSMVFDPTHYLQGLIQDMMEATQRLEDDQNIEDLLAYDYEDDNGNNGKRQRWLPLPQLKIPKWVERIAARAFVFGVNYLQGWLAYQGIKRANLERDRKQPKFPLF